MQQDGTQLVSEPQLEAWSVLLSDVAATSFFASRPLLAALQSYYRELDMSGLIVRAGFVSFCCFAGQLRPDTFISGIPLCCFSLMQVRPPKLTYAPASFSLCHKMP